MLKASPRKPRQANLRRALSSAYYAMFHALARCGADLLIGGSSAERSRPAWRQVYRSLEHGKARNACRNNRILRKFPQEIQAFGSTFIELQAKRHGADYDPLERYYKSDVAGEVDRAERAIRRFEEAPLKDRRAFAAFVLLRQPREE